MGKLIWKKAAKRDDPSSQGSWPVFLACLLFVFATLLAANPGHAQYACNPSWICDEGYSSQPSWDSQPSWRDQQEQEQLQNEIWDLENQNRRLRALRAQEREQQWFDDSSGLYIPHRQR